MKKPTVLKVGSTNPDFTGIYKKSDIEETLVELHGKVDSSVEWLEYVCDHLFIDVDNDEYNYIYEFLMNDKTIELKMVVDGDETRIVKC